MTARLQVLKLPAEVDGDGRVVDPFALVVDGLTDVTASDMGAADGLAASLTQFAVSIGARGALLCRVPLDVTQDS